MDTPSDIDQPIAQARSNISDLLASVRHGRRLYFLTSRGKRQAAIVPADLGELIDHVGGPDSAVEILKAHTAG